MAKCLFISVGVIVNSQAVKQGQKQLAFAPSSLILANNFKPVIWASCVFQGVSMKLRYVVIISALLMSGCSSNTNNSIFSKTKANVEQREKHLPEHLKTGKVTDSDVKRAYKHSRNESFFSLVLSLLGW